MAVIGTDIVVYGSAVMSDDDSTTYIGGGIDITKRVVFTDISPSGSLSIFSDSISDTTQTVTIYGRDVAGILVNETLPLNGTVAVHGSQIFERILKIVVSATHVGSITIEEADGGEDIVIMEATVLEIRRLFYNAVANIASAANKTYYEKIFFKNTNSTSALTNAILSEVTDPLNKITFGLVPTLDDAGNNGAFNRLVAPSGIVFGNIDVDIANGGNHLPTTSQGVWVALTLTAGDAATKSSFSLREFGETT